MQHFPRPSQPLLRWEASRLSVSFPNIYTSSRSMSAFNKRSSDLCPFAALGLDPGASPEELRARYLQLAKRLHPDAAGGDSGLSASAFVDLRKAYEAAVQVQQQTGKQSSTQADDWGPKSRKSDAAEAKLNEWQKEQEALRAFWASRSPIRRGDASYKAEMAKLLKCRLDAEKENANQNTRSLFSGVYGASGDGGSHFKSEGPSETQWAKEVQAELLQFGIERTSACASSSEQFSGQTQTRRRTWTSRTENKKLGTVRFLAALTVGVAVIVAATTVGNKTESRTERGASVQPKVLHYV